MRYTIDEILNNTPGYIFFKGKNFDKNKTYKLNVYEEFMDKADNSDVLFMPFKLTINDITWDTFADIERHVRETNLRAFVFDEIHFADEEHRNKMLDLLKEFQDIIEVVLIVPKNTRTLGDIANYTKNCKMNKNIKYLAVTGTIGKTSTTELLWSVVSNCRKAFMGVREVNLKSRTNHKFLEVEPDVEYCILELSGANPGYLKQFSELIVPDGVILTKVSPENLHTYGTLDKIATEKSSLLCAMSETSVAVINNQPLFKDATKKYTCKKIYIDEGSYELIKMDREGSGFKYKNEEYYIPVVGLHQIDNAIRVIELLKQFDFTYEEINNGFRQFKRHNFRWVVDEFPNDVVFITDCPNNPSFDTLMSSIDTFIQLYDDYEFKRVIISNITSLGDMEDDVLLQVAKRISKLNISELVCLTEQMIPVANYVRDNSNINVVWFKTENIDENAQYIKYLANNMNFRQANLIKGLYEEYMCYGETKNYLRSLLVK